MSDTIVVNAADDARPRAFTAMVGQPFARGVGRMIGAGNVSGQGYLCAGPKGCGKTSLARIIAMSVNCENRDTSTGDPCGECPSCSLALKGAHHNIMEINCASRRGIQDMKDLLQNVSLAVPKGFRVYILDEMHMLTKEAFSVLLKPFEQPPEGVVFIGTTTNPESIPETIVSRMPIIPIVPLEDEDLRRVLENVVESNRTDNPAWDKVTQADIDHAILSADGSARQAITTLSGVVFHGVSPVLETSSVDDIARDILDGNVAGVLQSASAALQSKTVHPAAIIRGVMDFLISKLDDYPDSSELAVTIAKLSSVCGQVSTSTPAIMVASQIAGCTPSKVRPEKIKATKNNVGQKHPTVNQMKITKSTRLDDVFDHMFSDSSRNILGEDYSDALDDTEVCDVFVDKNRGMLNIAIVDPEGIGEDFVSRVKMLFYPVKVSGI